MRDLTSSPRLLGALLLASIAAGCGGRGQAPPAPAPPDATYSVRGEIARLPDAGARDLWIRHEAISDFKDPDGKVVGMDSMTMPFELAADAKTDGLAVGDRISFRLEMRWQAGTPATVTAIEKLPSDTRLAFDPPPAEPAPGEGEGQPPAIPR